MARFNDGQPNTAPVEQGDVVGLRGNAAEWCADLFAPSLNPPAYRNDPELTAGPGLRVVRGGSWKDSQPQDIDPAFRNAWPEDWAAQWIGFRLVLSP